MSSRVVADLARLAVPALVGTSAFAGASFVGAPAASAAGGGCSSAKDGVTVVVQFLTGTAVGCAPGAPVNALAALRSAGFTTTGANPYGDAVLCSINGAPIAGVCPRMPPKEAYWAVFWAKRGGSWVYSDKGVTTLPAPVGTVVGFRFGSGAAPSVPVPAPFSTASSSTSKAANTSKPAPSSTTARSTSSAAKAASTAPTARTSSAAKGSTPAHPSSSTSSAAKSATPTASSTTATSAPGARSTTSSSAPVLPVPVVKARQSVKEGNQQKVVVTYSDGSKVTLAPSQAKDSTYKVGAAKPGLPSASTSQPMAKYSTQVPTPTSSTPHPSISTSGVVPMPVPQESTSRGHSNLPGILAGGGVTAAVVVGGVLAVRRRG